jgi:hypothetical protein
MVLCELQLIFDLIFMINSSLEIVTEHGSSLLVVEFLRVDDDETLLKLGDSKLDFVVELVVVVVVVVLLVMGLGEDVRNVPSSSYRTISV